MRKVSGLTTVLVLMLLGTDGRVDAQVSIGVTIGPPPPPRVVYGPPPPPPAPAYVWVPGYWYPAGHSHHYKWHEGYWTQPPYPAAHWVAPRHDGVRFYDGYWQGDHGYVVHKHDWDHKKKRDHDHHDR